MLADKIHGDAFFANAAEHKVLSSSREASFDNSLSLSAPLRQTNSLDRLLGGDWTDSTLSQGFDLSCPLISEGGMNYEPTIDVGAYIASKVKASAADISYSSFPATNGIDLNKQTQSDSERSSFCLVSDPTLSPRQLHEDQKNIAKRHRSLDHIPATDRNMIDNRFGLVMNGSGNFIPDKYSSSYFNQDSVYRYNCGGCGGQSFLPEQLAVDHQKMYMNYINGQHHFSQVCSLCRGPEMSLERVLLPHDEGGPCRLSNVQGGNWHPMHAVDTHIPPVAENYPIHGWPTCRSVSCPPRVCTTPVPAKRPGSPLYVFPGRPMEGMDESENDFLIAVAGKRKPIKKRENLPKESTAVLKKWLCGHISMPYPINEEKWELCAATGLDISQINNWFINARVRIWKPYVTRVFRKYKEILLKGAESEKNDHLVKRITEGENSTTMSMISLLSSCAEARRELEGDLNGTLCLTTTNSS